LIRDRGMAPKKPGGVSKHIQREVWAELTGQDRHIPTTRRYLALYNRAQPAKESAGTLLEPSCQRFIISTVCLLYKIIQHDHSGMNFLLDD
jgi:hypothetical protein